jgi:hypothetical protein
VGAEERERPVPAVHEALRAEDTDGMLDVRRKIGRRPSIPAELRCSGPRPWRRRWAARPPLPAVPPMVASPRP